MEDSKTLHQKYEEFGKTAESISLMVALLIHGANNMTQERDYYRTVADILEDPKGLFKEHPQEYARVFCPTYDKIPVTEDLFLVAIRIMHTSGFMGEGYEDLIDMLGLEPKSFNMWLEKWKDEEAELDKQDSLCTSKEH